MHKRTLQSAGPRQWEHEFMTRKNHSSVANGANVQTLHQPQPDFNRPPLELSPEAKNRLKGRLAFLYGEDEADRYFPELERICQVYYAYKTRELRKMDAEFDPAERFSQKDIILITYGDLLQGDGPTPLASLANFCDRYLEGTINTLHLLPFFPYSSDRGFSVVDFEQVDPNLGTWDNIWELEKRYNLMFDGVFNHVSSKSRWFQEFLNGNTNYRDFFIWFRSPGELNQEQRSQIFRPRTSDILTPYNTIRGLRYLWTTFSADQVDLNYKTPEVLLRVLEIMLLYVRNGADIIRLDAVTYLWSELGTSCAHLDQTHEVIKLFRDVLDLVAPRVSLITETNVPHDENISYFGDGSNEAQMVYNFALPPLVLHTFYTGDATRLSNWVEGLTLDSKTCTFFNFLDSHDGIGLMGVQEILSGAERQHIIERAQAHGGLISYKTGAGGVEEPYEINITWYSALNQEPEECGEDIAFQVKRFVASRIVAMIIQGVPGIYLHSLIGTRNDIEAVLSSDTNRAINRTVIDETAINLALEDPLSKISRISRELGRLISIRANLRAFHPNGDQRVLFITPEVFSLLRTSPEHDQTVLCLVNVTGGVVRLEVSQQMLNLDALRWLDLVSDMEWRMFEGRMNLTVLPYDVMWLEAQDEMDFEY
jgi:glycosidase